MKNKFYTGFAFFIVLVLGAALALLGFWVKWSSYWMKSDADSGGDFLSPFLLLILFSLLLVVSFLTYRIVQFLYRAQQERAYDVHQMEAWMWIYSKFSPSIPLPPSRDFAASPDFLKWLLYVVEQRRPKVVVEAGSGLSTILLADYYKQKKSDVRHFALENNISFGKKTKRWIENENVFVLNAPLRKYDVPGKGFISWYDLTALEQEDVKDIELLVIDGPHALKEKNIRYPAYPLLKDRLSPRTAILADDTKRPQDRAIMEAWAREGGFDIQYFDTEKGACLLTRNG